MKKVHKLKLFIDFYLGISIILLLSVIAMPLVIQHGLAVARDFIIEEGILETSLIIILFVIFYFVLKEFKHTLKAHELEVSRAGEEKSRLVSRLAEAFSYIGTVNVELHEIQSIFCGIEHYPQSKREFKLLVDHLASKAMTIAGTPWVVIRIISRCNGRTVKEYNAMRPKIVLPLACIGNREIIEDRPVKGLRKIASCQKNLDLLTVCILPAKHFSEEENILITAVTSQIEMLFLLYRAGFLLQQSFNDHNEKKL